MNCIVSVSRITLLHVLQSSRTINHGAVGSEKAWNGRAVQVLVRKAETERDGTLEQVSVVCAT